MWTSQVPRFLIRRCSSRSATSRARPPIFPSPGGTRRARRAPPPPPRAPRPRSPGWRPPPPSSRRTAGTGACARPRASRGTKTSSTRPGTSARSRRARGRRPWRSATTTVPVGKRDPRGRRASVVCFCLLSGFDPCTMFVWSMLCVDASVAAVYSRGVPRRAAPRARRQKTRRGRKRSYRHRRSKRARSSQPPAVSPGWPRARLPTEHRRRGAGRQCRLSSTRARPARVRSRVSRRDLVRCRRHHRRAETDPLGTPLDGSGGSTRAFPDPSRVPRAPRGRRALRGGSRDWTPPQRTAHRGSEKTLLGTREPFASGSGSAAVIFVAAPPLSRRANASARGAERRESATKAHRRRIIEQNT